MTVEGWPYSAAQRWQGEAWPPSVSCVAEPLIDDDELTMPHSATAPTQEFLQHHDISKPVMSTGARREAWQVNPRFEQLDPRPDQAMRSAAQRWRTDWDVGMEGVRDKNIFMRTAFSPWNNHYPDHQIDAITRLWACKVVIKTWAFSLIQLCLVEETSWERIAWFLTYKDYRTAKECTRKAFVDLALYCDTRDLLGVVTGDEEMTLKLPDSPKLKVA